MQQQRCRALLGLLAHVEPEVVEEVHVALQFLFALAFRCRTADKPTRNSLAVRLHHALQAMPLFVRRNLAGNTGVVHRGHINHEATGQGDVRRDARTLLPQRFLRDLDNNLLPFFQ